MVCFFYAVAEVDPTFELASMLAKVRLDLTEAQIEMAWERITAQAPWIVCIGRKWSLPHPIGESVDAADPALQDLSTSIISPDGCMPAMYINFIGVSARDFGRYLDHRRYPPPLVAHYKDHIHEYSGNYFEYHEVFVAPTGSNALYYERTGFHGTV